MITSDKGYLGFTSSDQNRPQFRRTQLSNESRRDKRVSECVLYWLNDAGHVSSSPHY